MYIYGDRDSISVNWLRYGLDDQSNGHSRKEIFLLAQASISVMDNALWGIFLVGRCGNHWSPLCTKEVKNS